ncbi:MAG TPA: hypothetical protein VFD01_05315 [Candidatus Dormibacteraeota bacterium]|nr:hypothetical protein [Candidatus Dormibacteraeota bacterium]
MSVGVRRRLVAVVAVVALVASIGAAGVRPALADSPPPPLSADQSQVDIGSSYGSGHFGNWSVDQWGLPAYDYTLDQQVDHRADLAEESGGDTAFHQVGNDYNHAFATNHGYTELWSQARTYEWANYYEGPSKHFSGGYGYLDFLDGSGKVAQSISTLYEDRPAQAQTERDFGVGYFRHSMSDSAPSDVPSPVSVDEHVYAPFGNDPVLLHDVTITNQSSSASESLAWFEYWDVNPAMTPGLPAYGPRNRALASPTYDPATHTLAVAQLPDVGDANPHTVDTDPLSIFAAPLGNTPVAAYETNLATFFGNGSRPNPDEVAAGRLSDSIAAPSAGGESQPGNTLFAFQTPVSLAPGQSVTLHYIYGMSHTTQGPDTAAPVTALVAKWNAAAMRPAPGDPLDASEAAWLAWVPKASLPSPTSVPSYASYTDYRWLARELEWDAYMVRSRSTPEEACNGQPILSQGGYYQYDQGVNDAYRDPLQHVLPMVYSDPALARGVIVYSAQEQSPGVGAIPYGMQDLCTPYFFGGESDDLDLWLLLAAAEYGLASRDVSFFQQPVPYLGGASTATLWDHLKLAYFHQENVIGRGAHGLPNAGTMGDWADFSVETNGLTESTLVAAQLAYVYPYLAALADLVGDSSFAGQLRASTATLDTALANQWVSQPDNAAGAPMGWYNRGYAGPEALGTTPTSISALSEPWALLAAQFATPQEQALIDPPSRQQAIVDSWQCYLLGTCFTAQGGPSKIGSGLSPDPNSSSSFNAGALSNSTSDWFAIDDPMAWAYGTTDENVAGADAYAWDELTRNTLANLATQHPDHWDGVISTDDVCAVWWVGPYSCGVETSTAIDGQILHQESWGLFAFEKLAGLQPTGTGFRVAPHLPFDGWSLRVPSTDGAGYGLAQDYAGGLMRGYITPLSSASVDMQVRVPAGVDPNSLRAWVNGRPVHPKPTLDQSDYVEFTMDNLSAGSTADWAVTWDPVASAFSASAASPSPATMSSPTGTATASASPLPVGLPASVATDRPRATGAGQ